MNERQERIYRIIEKLNSATIEHLAKEVFASPATIRRDLAKMEASGLILRVWGGATLSSKTTIDPPEFVRSNINVEAKKKIARKAISLIDENSSIFLPSGTTVKEFCKVLSSLSDVAVITNSLDVIETLKDNTSHKIFSLGGELHEHYDFVGPITHSQIERFSADYLMFSCSGITKNGFTSNDLDRLEIITRMQKNSTKTILLCDSSKVNKKCMYNGFDFSKIDFVITEKPLADQELMEILKDKLIIA